MFARDQRPQTLQWLAAQWPAGQHITHVLYTHVVDNARGVYDYARCRNTPRRNGDATASSYYLLLQPYGRASRCFPTAINSTSHVMSVLLHTCTGYDPPIMRPESDGPGRLPNCFWAQILSSKQPKLSITLWASGVVHAGAPSLRPPILLSRRPPPPPPQLPAAAAAVYHRSLHTCMYVPGHSRVRTVSCTAVRVSLHNGTS